MKTYRIILLSFFFGLTACIESSLNTNNPNNKDETFVGNGVDKNDSKDKTDNITNKVIVVENLNENMFDITNFFSSEELEKIRYNLIRQLQVNYWWSDTRECLSAMEEEGIDVGNRHEIYKRTDITNQEISENMYATYCILLKKNPLFKPVSSELFAEKITQKFNFDVANFDTKSSFYTNKSNEDLYGIYLDLKNHVVSFDYLSIGFKEEPDWIKFNEDIEKKGIGYNTTEAFDLREKYHKDFLNNAVQEKYTMYCSKSSSEYLFHCNNYVFYDNQASLSWLLTHYEGTSFLTTLFEFFNYDQEPRINKYMLDIFFSKNDVSKGYPLKTYEYEHIFGEVESCTQTHYYKNFQFKVRTGLMQYVVDNCYDDTDLDDCGLKKDKYICVMEDCFDYLFKKVLEGDKYKESENCHYYQTCAYLAYYLQKAYDNYVSHDDGQPRCWHNALANNLYEDIRNNDSRFENYVKENHYFNLEGFEEIMKDAHEQAMRE